MFITKRKLNILINEKICEAQNKVWDEVHQERYRERIEQRFDKIESRLWELERPLNNELKKFNSKGE